MSTKINIENYESFYLDFLEGNLDESDTAVLFEFLEAHPDLVVEEDSLVYLPEAEFVGLDSQSKAGLKFPDTNQKIGLNNIELFLIASVEKQLSQEKSRELQVFLNANPFYAEELTLYQRSRLEADLSIVFPEKRSLRKGGVIVPMYARFAAAAASVALVVGLLNFNQDHQLQTASIGKTGNGVHLKMIDPSKGGQSNAGSKIQNPGSGQADIQENGTVVIHVSGPSTPSVTIAKQENRLKARPVKAITNRPLLNEVPLAYVEPFAPEKTEPAIEDNYAMVEMKNPIKPITKRISEVIRQDVDFRTSRAARKKTGGFYLKIGKFEVSRKVYDNTSVAVK